MIKCFVRDAYVYSEHFWFGVKFNNDSFFSFRSSIGALRWAAFTLVHLKLMAKLIVESICNCSIVSLQIVELFCPKSHSILPDECWPSWKNQFTVLHKRFQLAPPTISTQYFSGRKLTMWNLFFIATSSVVGGFEWDLLNRSVEPFCRLIHSLPCCCCTRRQLLVTVNLWDLPSQWMRSPRTFLSQWDTKKTLDCRDTEDLKWMMANRSFTDCFTRCLQRKQQQMNVLDRVLKKTHRGLLTTRNLVHFLRGLRGHNIPEPSWTLDHSAKWRRKTEVELTI